jgi:NADH-quinone oxidoreductase subunit N
MHYYLGLEIISFSLIIAVGCQKKMLAAEAAIKLFLVSAFSSGLFLLGISMFYKSFGSICIEHIFWFRDLEGQKAIYFMILALFIKTPTFPFYV